SVRQSLPARAAPDTAVRATPARKLAKTADTTIAARSGIWLSSDIQSIRRPQRQFFPDNFGRNESNRGFFELHPTIGRARKSEGLSFGRSGLCDNSLRQEKSHDHYRFV